MADHKQTPPHCAWADIESILGRRDRTNQSLCRKVAHTRDLLDFWTRIGSGHRKLRSRWLRRTSDCTLATRSLKGPAKIPGLRFLPVARRENSLKMYSWENVPGGQLARNGVSRSEASIFKLDAHGTGDGRAGNIRSVAKVTWLTWATLGRLALGSAAPSDRNLTILPRLRNKLWCGYGYCGIAFFENWRRCFAASRLDA